MSYHPVLVVPPDPAPLWHASVLSFPQSSRRWPFGRATPGARRRREGSLAGRGQHLDAAGDVEAGWFDLGHELEHGEVLFRALGIRVGQAARCGTGGLFSLRGGQSADCALDGEVDGWWVLRRFRRRSFNWIGRRSSSLRRRGSHRARRQRGSPGRWRGSRRLRWPTMNGSLGSRARGPPHRAPG